MYKVYYLPLPADIFGAVHLCPDGSYIVAINEKLTEDQRKDVLKHELTHIEKDHFHDPRSIREIEAEAEG